MTRKGSRKKGTVAERMEVWPACRPTAVELVSESARVISQQLGWSPRLLR